MINDAIDNLAPKFLTVIEPMCAKSKFLTGDNLTTCDFWIGGLYTNFLANPQCFAPERWAALLAKFPNFKAYGERYAEANKAFLESRPKYAV